MRDHEERAGHLSLAGALVALCLGCAPGPTQAPEPEPEPVSVRPGVNDNYFDAGQLETWVGRFESETREVAVRRVEILQALRLAPGAVVADVGAGTGLFFGDWSRTVGPEGRVYATDIAPMFLDRLRARVE